MLVLNSAINPWVYAFFKRDIKKEMIKKLTCRKTRRNCKINIIAIKNARFEFTVFLSLEIKKCFKNPHKPVGTCSFDSFFPII